MMLQTIKIKVDRQLQQLNQGQGSRNALGSPLSITRDVWIFFELCFQNVL